MCPIGLTWLFIHTNIQKVTANNHYARFLNKSLQCISNVVDAPSVIRLCLLNDFIVGNVVLM